MLAFVFVGLGGFIGSVSRYGLNILTTKFLGPAFPFATAAVNIIGCFLIGLLFAAAKKFSFSEAVTLFLTTGVLGGFTTFSAFGFETFRLLQLSRFDLAVINISVNLFLGIAAVWIGHHLGIRFLPLNQ